MMAEIACTAVGTRDADGGHNDRSATRAAANGEVMVLAKNVLSAWPST
jgi:hypothetical protein